MGAPDLLQHLRTAGLKLTLMPTGGLHVAPRSALTDDHRAAIRAERDALVLALGAEMEQFTERQARFARMGAAADAEHLAKCLALRDCDNDSRRLCLECAALADDGHCMVAARGNLAGAARGLQPVPTILQRCGGFTLAEGLR